MKGHEDVPVRAHPADALLDLFELVHHNVQYFIGHEARDGQGDFRGNAALYHHDDPAV